MKGNRKKSNKAISVKIAQLLKNITFYWSQNTVGYLFHCCSQRLADFDSIIFLSQQYTMFSISGKGFDSVHVHRCITHLVNYISLLSKTSPLERLTGQLRQSFQSLTKYFNVNSPHKTKFS